MEIGRGLVGFTSLEQDERGLVTWVRGGFGRGGYVFSGLMEMEWRYGL